MKVAIEIIACLIMVGGLAGIFIERIWRNRGIDVRVIQFLTIVLIIPVILILALEDILNGQTTAALIGTVIGYILSGIGKNEKNSTES
jgi:predicted transporter